MKIINVKTEYLKNPVGLDITSPRITWNVADCRKQTSYQISYKVNGESSDSGIIESSSTNYTFRETFKSRDRVEFVIHAVSEDSSCDSEPSFFEIGLLSKEDWTAYWISGNYHARKSERYPVDCFKKEFKSKDAVKARLYISALGLYEAHINNQRVGDYVLAPGSTDYRKRVQYQVYDVTSLIKDDNEITIELADGWYRGSIGARGKRCVFGKTSAVIAQLELTDRDGNVTTVNTDGSWKWSNDGPIEFADLKDGENADLNKVPTYDGIAKVIKPEVNLTSGNNSYITEHETFEPIGETKSSTGRRVFEFRQNLAGYFYVRYNAHKGDKVHITMGELLDKETGNVSLHNVQLPNGKQNTPKQEVNLVSKEGLNEYKGKFFIAGYRYLDVEGDIEIIELKQIALYSSIDEASSFECSNELINIFRRNALWSLKSNSADVPTDCPTRERMGWTGDSQVFFNSACYLTDYAAFARKHVVDVYDRQDRNGRLPQIAPYNAEDWYMDVMNGSPGWADVGILTPYRFYLMYGDKRILENNYEGMRKYIHFMLNRCGAAKGIYAVYAKPLRLSKENRRYGINTGQSYGEWAEPNDIKAFVWTDFCEPHPEESMAYTSWMCDLMITISNLVGRTDENELYARYRDGIRKAYQELITKERFSIDTTVRQAKLVRPLYLHLLTPEQETKAKERLIKVIDDYKWRLGTGFLSTPFILDVLADISPDYAYRMLENEEMPGWLYMAKNDTGTIWEGWEGPNSQLGISSLNHYSKGAVAEWLYRGMCGINVAGENRFTLKPIIGGKETYASASYDSMYGRVSLSWKKDNGKIIIDVSVPSNTSADFIYGSDVKELETGTYHFEY